MKIKFSLKLTNEMLGKEISDYYPKANIDNISRSDGGGVVTISGIEENTQTNLERIIKRASDKIADVKLNCVVKKIIKEIPVQIPMKLDINTDDIDTDDVEDEDDKESFDFNAMLTRQITSHVKKAKKEINKLGKKFKEMIIKYDENTGNIESRTKDNTNNIDILNESLLKLEGIIDVNHKNMKELHNGVLTRIVGIENELSSLDACINDTLSIFKNRKK